LRWCNTSLVEGLVLDFIDSWVTGGQQARDLPHAKEVIAHSQVLIECVLVVVRIHIGHQEEGYFQRAHDLVGWDSRSHGSDQNGLGAGGQARKRIFQGPLAPKANG